MITILLFLVFIIFYIFFLHNIVKRIYIYIFYEKILFELEISKKLVWDKIFREKIYAQQVHLFKLTKDEIDTIATEYVSLVIKYLGPSIYEDLVILKGDKESIWIELAAEFVHKVINTEIQNIDEKVGSTIIDNKE